MTARSALMQDRGASYLDRSSSQGKPLSPIDFMGEEAISALTGLYRKAKLRSTEADSVPTSQCKPNVVNVPERSSENGM